MKKTNYVQRFVLHDVLGEGTYGAVYKATDTKTNSVVAIKQIFLRSFKQTGVPSTALREISILKELDHPNIVKILDVVYEEKNLALVLEFMEMDLKKYIQLLKHKGQRMNMMQIKSFLYQILKGLAFCHEHLVLHRDIKPQNLLINKRGIIKLADFGLARSVPCPDRVLTREVQSLCYWAPEIVLGQNQYSSYVDIWSVGCIFAEMILQHELFNADSEIDLLFKIFRVLGTPNETNWPGVSSLAYYQSSFPNWKENRLSEVLSDMPPDGMDLLHKMLKYPPHSRISAKEALKHPFFDDLDVTLYP